MQMSDPEETAGGVKLKDSNDPAASGTTLLINNKKKWQGYWRRWWTGWLMIGASAVHVMCIVINMIKYV